MYRVLPQPFLSMVIDIIYVLSMIFPSIIGYFPWLPNLTSTPYFLNLRPMLKISLAVLSSHYNLIGEENFETLFFYLMALFTASLDHIFINKMAPLKESIATLLKPDSLSLQMALFHNLIEMMPSLLTKLLYSATFASFSLNIYFSKRWVSVLFSYNYQQHI